MKYPLPTIVITLIWLATISLGNVARYDNYRLYRVHIDTKEQLGMVKQLESAGFGIEFYGHAREINQKLTILVPSAQVANVENLFLRYDIANKILLPNIQQNMDRQFATVKPKGTPGDQHDFKHYSQLDTIYDYLRVLVDRHDFITPIEIGNSFEGRPIKGIKISKRDNNTGIFVEGGIHAREWISPATSTYIISELLTSSDPDVQHLANNFDWYFFPVVNPDGYVYTFEHDRLWRKNRKPYGLCLGVDLNRNFDSNWNGTGSSSDPCQYDFAGSSANSEPEVRAISNFLKNHQKDYRIKTFLSLHSFSQLIMFPYGSTAEKVENYDDLKRIGEQGAAAIKNRHGREYKTGSIIETIYPSSGGSSDWVAHALDIKISYTFELRGSPEDVDMFILPADQIIPVGEEITDAFKAMLKEAEILGYYN